MKNSCSSFKPMRAVDGKLKPQFCWPCLTSSSFSYVVNVLDIYLFLYLYLYLFFLPSLLVSRLVSKFSVELTLWAYYWLYYWRFAHKFALRSVLLWRHIAWISAYNTTNHTEYFTINLKIFHFLTFTNEAFSRPCWLSSFIRYWTNCTQFGLYTST